MGLLPLKPAKVLLSFTGSDNQSCGAQEFHPAPSDGDAGINW
jgi:hypothetical protein